MSKTTVSILTLNCFLRPPLVSRPGGEEKDVRARYISEELVPQFDVCTFQECFGTFSDKRRKILVKGAQKLGYEAVHIKLGSRLGHRGIKLMDGGLLILSKFPISETDTLYYKSGLHSDKLAAKGVLYAQLIINENQTLHLFTTHTQASYHHKAQNKDIEIRKKQLSQLVAFVHKKTENFKDDPIVITGDFNMDALQPSCPEYDHIFQNLKKSSFVDAIMEKHGKHLPTSVHYNYKVSTGEECGSSLFRDDAAALLESGKESEIQVETNSLTFWARQCLDFVFVRPGKNGIIDDANVRDFVPEKKQNWRQVSDHCGIDLRLTL